MSDVPLLGEGTRSEAAARIAGADASCVPRAVRVRQRWQDQAMLVRAQLGTSQRCDAGLPRGTVLCHRMTLPGCAPGKGCRCIPQRGVPQKPSSARAPRPCHDPFHTWTPAVPQPSLARGVARSVTMFGCF